MPIRDAVRNEALAYVDAHLIDESVVRAGFDFVHNQQLVDLIVLELKSARYIYRLMEMLDLKDVFSHPFCKFQIVQYAGVFEAAIDYLIFDRVYKSQKLQELMFSAREEIESHDVLTSAPALSKNTNLSFGGQEATVAVLKKRKKPRVNIRFEERLKVCSRLSLVDEKLAGEILDFYKKRHSVHLSAKLKSAINVELSDTKRGFRRINAFCENVKRGLKKHGEPI